MSRPVYTRPDVLKTEAERPRWYFRPQEWVRVGPNPNDIKRTEGKTVYLGFVDEFGKREAEKKRDKILREGRYNDTPTLLKSHVRFADLLAVYRSTYLPGLKPNSRESYQNDIKAHIEPAFVNLRLFEVDPIRVQQWVYAMESDGLSRASRKKYLGILSSIFEAAGMWGYTESRNPCKGIKIGGAGEVRDLRPLEPWEAKRLIEVCAGVIQHEDSGPHDAMDSEVNAENGVEICQFRSETREGTNKLDRERRDKRRDSPERRAKDLRLIVETALYTGLRISEVLALTWGAIDIRNRVLSVKQGKSQRGVIAEPKTAAGRRTVPIGFLADRFERPEGAKDSDLVFPGAVYTNLQHAFRKIAASIGIAWIGFGFHTLRVSYSTYRVMLGYAPPSREHQEAMGHSSAAMTARYVRMRETDLVDRLRKLVESSGIIREADREKKVVSIG